MILKDKPNNVYENEKKKKQNKVNVRAVRFWVKITKRNQARKQKVRKEHTMPTHHLLNNAQKFAIVIFFSFRSMRFINTRDEALKKNNRVHFKNTRSVFLPLVFIYVNNAYMCFYFNNLIGLIE